MTRHPSDPPTFRPGVITAADIAGYTAPFTAPTHVSYDGLDVLLDGPAVLGRQPPSARRSTS